jgi:hypothetical protein
VYLQVCYFITTTLPAGSNIEAAASIARQYGRIWEPLNNPFIIPQLEPGEEHFTTTSSHCDCGTQIGLRTRPAAGRNERAAERKISRLRHKGWSNAKIERWLSEKRATEKKRKKRASEVSGVTLIGAWEDLLRTLIAQLQISYVGLLLHWYSGGLQSERINILRRVSVPVSNLNPTFLLEIEEDVLYRIH